MENSGNITGKELENKFHLTRKQLSYGIGKINEYLLSCGYEEITRAGNGKITIPANVIASLDLQEMEEENQEVFFSKEERISILYLMLLTSNEELSLQHFISELKVSKNTVLADLKKLDKSLQQNKLKLSYGRQNGYTLSGSEYTKRQLLITTVNNVIIQYGHASVVKDICDIHSASVAEVRKALTAIEEELGLRFVGDMLEANSYLFAIIIQRIKDNLLLDEIPESLRSINETKEFSVVGKYVSKLGVSDKNEQMYLTALIQGMKIESVRWVRDAVNEFQLRKVVRKIITNYENLTGFTIREKDELENLLVHHCGPALYRIRYDFHIGLDIMDYVLPAYDWVHEIIRKAAKPLEELVGKEIPEKELVYITLIVASFSVREGLLVKDFRKNAIVVCQNGVTVSRVLLSLLTNLFPEISFKRCMSAEQFKDYDEPFDLVFSTIQLDTEQKVYIIDPLMNEKQRRSLREKVLKSIDDESTGVILNNTILQIAQKITGQSDNSVPESKPEAAGELHLKDILPADNVRVFKEELDWKEAIEFVAIPLLYKHKIQIQYVEAIINSITGTRPYLAIADGVVVVHAGIDDGVRDVGMSMLVLPKKITIYDYLEAKIIIMLATPDYDKHLTALNELILILEDKQKLEKMKQAKIPEDILELL